jgi:RimJ/RimL family protein N-acetyltransferase
MSGFLETNLYSPTLPILLRPPQSTDAQALSTILSNPANTKHDPMCSSDPTTPTQAESLISKMRLSASATLPTRVNLVVVLLPSPNAAQELEVIGLSGFGGIGVIEGKRWADVGAMINSEHRGKGYAIESMRLSIEFALAELSVEGISCEMLDVNTEMLGLVEKNFGWVGVKNTKRFGIEVRFEITREEWAKTKERMGWF